MTTKKSGIPAPKWNRKKVRSITLLVRKKQDTNGNTYHSISILLNGKHYKNIGKTYGYGSHYVQTAMACFIENKIIKCKSHYESLYKICNDHGIEYHTDEVYISKNEYHYIDWS